MNLKIFFLISFYGLISISCATEKPSTSPTRNLLTNISETTPSNINRSISNDLDLMRYSAEITNSFANSKPCSNKNINEEVATLKFNVNEYLYAVKEYNTVGKERALYNYEKSYKKIQKLKNKLPEYEQEVLNRLLVNIKTNITLIESLKHTP